jgi:anti-sigma regulatory factor (Ser/Thr protein kinase)
VTLHHIVLFHADDSSLATAASAFVRSGLSAGEAVMVAMPSAGLNALHSELGAGQHGVNYVDMTSVGRNPGAIISAWTEFVASSVASGRRMRGIGQPVWPTRTAAELDECQRHEALLNVAFLDGPEWPLLCPYDTSQLSPATVRAAMATHPLLARVDGTWRANDEYLPHEHGIFDGDLDVPPPHAEALSFTRPRLADARAVVRTLADTAGLARQRAADLILAVSEIATNSVMYGGEIGRLSVWSDERSVICEIRDAGHISDPLVGRRRPADDVPSGRGLWLAHRVCDLVQVRSGRRGTVVRLSMHRE